MSQLTWILIASYFLGCIATGFYLVRIRIGKDVREMGSGNIGARNVGRVLGSSGFWITLVGDFAKGAAAVWVARYFTADNHVTALAMLAAVLGHVWPIQLRFRGGKGIATSLGALAVCDFHLALTFVGLFAVIYLILRRTTLGGLVAFACLPLASMFMDHDPLKVVLISILAGLVLLAHRKNLVEEITSFVLRRNPETKADQPIK
ncbi:glycerol-3-phosphate acyltransferase [Pedosphaera parvula]|uniref:glycerol-3-phosphate acyltransferase n=1 Tax=Pedosphaera parvula TaxID=1032527 RepID=UPI00135F13C5|nr:glycerol-3-phosphate acyltransferase [Pedosphaera parvula]